MEWKFDDFASVPDADWNDWRWQMRHAVTDAGALVRDGAGTPREVQRRYPFLATPYWLRLMKRTGFADGPVALQTLPDGRELLAPVDGECYDPFREAERSPLPGLVHRFPDRVLVVASLACAMRCRHCTRKNLLNVHAAPDMDGILRIRDYVLQHPAVREVLLSGGDPLMLNDDAIVERVEAFASLPQIDAVRIGTRVPCTLPMRVTDALASRLGASRKVWVNTQFNHALEITDEAAAACARLVDSGIPVSNQAVLLRGVNDSASALADLFRGLQRIRVRPYYLFVCDPVAGTSHFRVPEARAAELEEQVASMVGGLALPRFVRDAPDAPRKIPVSLGR
jgi:lysine 2,3-aminomutase